MSGPRLGIAWRRQVERSPAEQAGHRGQTRPVSAAARRKIAIASPVARPGHVHDQLGDVRRGRAVPQHHVHRAAAQALPDRSRQGRVGRLADQVVPERQPVAVLDAPARPPAPRAAPPGPRPARRRRARSAHRPRTGGRAPTPVAARPGRPPTAGRSGSRPSRGIQRQPRPDEAGGTVAGLHQLLLAQAAQQLGQPERLAADLGQRGQQSRRPASPRAGRPRGRPPPSRPGGRA